MPSSDAGVAVLEPRTTIVHGRDIPHLDGGQGPVALVIHDDGDGAPRAYAPLTRRHRVVALDVAALAGAADEPEAAELVRALLEARGITDVGLVGSGSGARLADRAAGLLPTVRALVLAAPAGPIDGLASGVDAPTLVLVGEDDKDFAGQDARACADLFPSSALVFVYAARSHIAMDRPEAFADVVDDFLERGLGFARPQTSSLINP